MENLNARKEPRERLYLLHETKWTYSRPVTFTPHRLVPRPREGRDVQLETRNLETSPTSTIRW